MLKLFVILMCTLATGYGARCNQKTAVQYLKAPTYDFSVKLLDRVAQETSGHFVFSPISTWLQLLALIDGAQGKTLDEILNVTRYNTLCSRNIVRQIFNSLDTELSATIKRRSIFVIDKLLNVKDSFVANVEMLNAAKVLQTSFSTKFDDQINGIGDSDMTDILTDLLDDNDFKMTVLLLADTASMKANWRSPFDPVYTKPERFYSYENVHIGYVNMMNQIGSFNFNYIPEINAEAIELPFSDRASMILLLPTRGTAEDLFFRMKNIRIAPIFKQLKSDGPKLINLKMPRFNLTTNIDNVPELLYDMGIKRIFSPRFADFKNISDYKIYVSLMANIIGIEVTETGIEANVGPQNIVKHKDSIDVSFNRPFAFLLADKLTNVILFAGIYSEPTIF